MDVKKSLHDKLRILNSETKEIYSLLNDLSEENLHDTTYGWSIIQVMSHLNMAEAGSLQYMKKKMQAGDQMKDSGVLNSLRLFFSKYFMQSNIKWKAPAVVANPKGDYSYEEIKKTWSQTRENVEQYINDFPEKFLSKEVMKHPLAGRLTIGGTLDSFIFHQRHHVHQIKRIRKEIGI